MGALVLPHEVRSRHHLTGLSAVCRQANLCNRQRNQESGLRNGPFSWETSHVLGTGWRASHRLFGSHCRQWAFCMASESALQAQCMPREL